MSKFQNDSIFWIEVEKIKPNPYQPRKEFNQEKLKYLSESIRQYGILQPLVVTRHEVQKEDGGLKTEYELIAGERRLRASKLAGLQQVPAIIRTEEDGAGAKLELAIIENLQREDLNPMDRALAFEKLAGEFGLKHTEIAKKVGKSREYVSNTLRLLLLPEEMRQAVSSGRITEGHSRPILMLKDRPAEQETLFKEILLKRLTVRDAEAIARKVAVEKVRKKDYYFDPEIAELEGQLAESLGTRVQIEKREVGGKLTIDFFSNDDLKKILDLVHSNDKKNPSEMLDNYIKSNGIVSFAEEARNDTKLTQNDTEQMPKETEQKQEDMEENTNNFKSESVNMNESVVDATEEGSNAELTQNDKERTGEGEENLVEEVVEDIVERKPLVNDTFENNLHIENSVNGNQQNPAQEVVHRNSIEENNSVPVSFENQNINNSLNESIEKREEENNLNGFESNQIPSKSEGINLPQETISKNNQNQEVKKEDKTDEDDLYSLKDFNI